jgi:AAA+ ATPase superfamily predicted ATPase
MSNNRDVIVNPQAFSADAQFFGRGNEVEKLLATLSNEAGSTVLVAGDRDSGKTTLIREAVRRLKSNMSISFWKHPIQKLKLLRRRSVIYLDVPLVPNTTKVDDLRNTVLSLMVQSLNAHHDLLSWREKWLLPFRYEHYLKKLYNSLTYKRRVEKKGASLTASLKGQGATLDKSIEQEIDMSVIDIELFLKNFFIRFADKVVFIIAFDELDKYSEVDDGSAKAIEPHHYIKELKNLFTLSKAKFIFTATENYYRTVDEKLKSNAGKLDDYKFSLFMQKILINQLSPDDFKDYFEHLCIMQVKEADDVARYEILLLSVMWISNMYPFAAKKLIKEFAIDSGEESYIDLIEAMNELLKYGENLASLHFVMNTVYKTYANNADDYINRYLYKSLKKVTTYFYRGNAIKINRNNLSGIIYSDLEFSTTAEADSYLLTEFVPTREPDLDSSEDGWESYVFDLNNVYVKKIHDAITQLVWLFEKAGLVITANTDSISLVEIAYSSDSQSKHSVEEAIKNISRTTDEYKKTRDEIREIRDARLKSYDPGIEKPKLVTVMYGDNKSVAGTEFGDSWMFNSDFSSDIKLLRKFIADLDALLPAHIAEQVRTHLGSTIPASDPVDWELTANEYSAKMLFAPTKEEIESNIANQEYDKVIVINAQEKIHNPTKIKYFDIDGNWSNLVSEIDAINSYIDEHSAIEEG